MCGATCCGARSTCSTRATGTVSRLLLALVVGAVEVADHLGEDLQDVVLVLGVGHGLGDGDETGEAQQEGGGQGGVGDGGLGQHVSGGRRART